MWFYCLITLRWESHEPKSESQRGALAARDAHGRAHSIQNGKHDSGQDTQGGDLIQRQGALRDKDGGGGHDQTLDQILDDTIDNLGETVAQHVLFYIPSQEKNSHYPMVSFSFSVALLYTPRV